MNCFTVEPLIGAYLDGELNPGQQLQIREHFETCATCKEVHAQLERLEQRLRSDSLYFEAPEHLRQGVVTSLRTSATAQLPQPIRRWKWMALAASVLLALSAATNVVLTRSYDAADHAIAREVLSEHVRSMLSNRLIDVVSPDQHTVKPWFAGKLDFSPNVKDLTSQGFSLSGGRVDYLNGRPVAALVFQRAKHTINLFIWPAGSIKPEEFSQNGYHLVAWNQDGLTYWAVSDVNKAELQHFSFLYKN